MKSSAPERNNPFRGFFLFKGQPALRAGVGPEMLSPGGGDLIVLHFISLSILF